MTTLTLLLTFSNMKYKIICRKYTFTKRRRAICVYIIPFSSMRKKNYKSVDFTTSISRTLASCETLYSRRIPSICAIVPSLLYLGAQQEHSRNESQIRIEEDIHKRTHTRTRSYAYSAKREMG